MNCNPRGKSLMADETVAELEQALWNVKEENANQIRLRLCNIFKSQQPIVPNITEKKENTEEPKTKLVNSYHKKTDKQNMRWTAWKSRREENERITQKLKCPLKENLRNLVILINAKDEQVWEILRLTEDPQTRSTYSPNCKLDFLWNLQTGSILRRSIETLSEDSSRSYQGRLWISA